MEKLLATIEKDEEELEIFYKDANVRLKEFLTQSQHEIAKLEKELERAKAAHTEEANKQVVYIANCEQAKNNTSSSLLLLERCARMHTMFAEDLSYMKPSVESIGCKALTDALYPQRVNSAFKTPIVPSKHHPVSKRTVPTKEEAEMPPKRGKQVVVDEEEDRASEADEEIPEEDDDPKPNQTVHGSKDAEILRFKDGYNATIEYAMDAKNRGTLDMHTMILPKHAPKPDKPFPTIRLTQLRIALVTFRLTPVLQKHVQHFLSRYQRLTNSNPTISDAEISETIAYKLYSPHGRPAKVASGGYVPKCVLCEGTLEKEASLVVPMYHSINENGIAFECATHLAHVPCGVLIRQMIRKGNRGETYCPVAVKEDVSKCVHKATKAWYDSLKVLNKS